MLLCSNVLCTYMSSSHYYSCRLCWTRTLYTSNPTAMQHNIQPLQSGLLWLHSIYITIWRMLNIPLSIISNQLKSNPSNNVTQNCMIIQFLSCPYFKNKTRLGRCQGLTEKTRKSQNYLIYQNFLSMDKKNLTAILIQYQG